MKQLAKYGKCFQMGLQSAMEYRADFLLSLLSGGFIILIQCFLWTAIFQSSSSPLVYGYTYSQMMAYSIIAGLAAKMTSTGFEWEIAEDIKNGGLSKFIVQPVGYFLYRMASFMGRKTLQLAILAIISAAALFAMKGWVGLELETGRVLLFIPMVILAAALNFLIYYALSTLAFVMTEVWGVFVAAGQGILMLSGGIFPLDIFGKTVNRIFDLLPFKYIVFYPVNILNGRLTAQEIYQGLWVLLAWIALLLLLAGRCWKWGMKRYVAVGG